MAKRQLSPPPQDRTRTPSHPLAAPWPQDPTSLPPCLARVTCVVLPGPRESARIPCPVLAVCGRICHLGAETPRPLFLHRLHGLQPLLVIFFKTKPWLCFAYLGHLSVLGLLFCAALLTKEWGEKAWHPKLCSSPSSCFGGTGPASVCSSSECS